MPTTNPVPSQDPSDLLFNAGKLDEVLNGTGTSFTDRLGTARRTVAGMNADFDAQLADAESDLNVYRADAAASAAQALGYLNTIRTTSYGAYATDPATDPLGNPPNVGDEYFNTTSNLLKRFNGTTWQASDINTANLAAPSGSSLIGYDNGTVQDVLDGAKPMQSYTALRNYTGRATGVRITTPGIDGFFQHDPTDTISLDNNGTIIVGADGRRWKRNYSGAVNPRWFGLSANGTDIDSPAIATAISKAGNEAILSWSGQSRINTRVIGGAGQLNLFPRLVGDTAQDYMWSVIGSDQTLIGANFSGASEGAGGAQGIGHTGGDRIDTAIIASRVDVARFGVLINYDSKPAGSTSNGLVVGASFIKSGFDGVELNGDDNFIQYNAIFGNIIDAGANQPGTNDAFAVGLSSTRYSAVVGNAIKGSKARALHAEDKQKGTVFSSNTGLTSRDGIWLGQDPATDAQCDGIIAVGNHLTHTAANATAAGISVNTATTRSPTRNVFVANQLVGFGIGASFGPRAGSNTAKVCQQIVDANVFDGAATALRAETQQQVHGHNLAVAPTTLFSLSNRASAGRMSATAAPTTIIDRIDALFPGAFCRGFDFPVEFTHSGGGYQNLPMFPAGDRMSGKIVCRGESATAGGWWCSADILWDGATLNIANILRHMSGNAVINGATPFAVVGGNLCAHVSYPTGYVSTMYVDFDGIYYKI